MSSPNSARPLVVLTGASSGIGRATVNKLAAQGWDFFFAGQDADGLAKTKASAEAQFVNGSVFIIDAGFTAV